MLRVLMTGDAVGGVWTYCLTLARELARAHREPVEIDLAILGPLPDHAQRAAAAAIPGLRLHARPFKLEWMPDADDDLGRAGDWLCALAADAAPDLVHLNGYAHAALPFDVPKLVVAHSCVLSWWRAVHGETAPPSWRGYARAVRLGLDAADHVVAPTEAMRDALVACHGDVASLSVIPNGIPPVDGSFRKKKMVLGAGRIWDKAKNLATLAAVAPELGCPVWIAGDTAGTVQGSRRAREVRYLGPLAAHDMAGVFARAAIFAHPARYEPFGLAVLEAAAHGCALVLGDIPSLRENWADVALFVAPDDAAALAAALRELAEDTERCAALGEAARQRAARFTARATADAYLARYAALTTGAEPATHPTMTKETECVS
jgi:glycogen(starch) synthase